MTASRDIVTLIISDIDFFFIFKLFKYKKNQYLIAVSKDEACRGWASICNPLNLIYSNCQ